MNPSSLKSLPVLVACALAGCSTVSDLIVTNIPNPHEGRTSIVVRKRAQEAELRKGGAVVAVAHISTGREGYETPVGRFRVLRKDRDHRSSLYGDYVDGDERIVKANVDARKGARPPYAHFLGAPMPFFLEFSPGYGLHAGHLPGYPASHGCVRLSYWKARQFFNEARVGTPVTVKPCRPGAARRKPAPVLDLDETQADAPRSFFRAMKPHLTLLLAALAALPVVAPAAIKQREHNFLEDAETALRNHDPDAALRGLDAAIKASPGHAPAHFWRGRVLADKGEFDKALADFDAAIRLAPGYADAYAYRGYVQEKRREPDAALADLNRALRLDPMHEFGLLCRGLLLGDRGETRAALGDLDAVIEMNPNNSLALGTRARVHLLRRDWPAALADFDRCLALDPKDALATSGRGSAHYFKGELPAAVADFTRTIELLPKNAVALAQRGHAWLGLQEKEKALADFEAALVIEPKSPAALLGRAEVCRISKDWKSALRDYDAALALAPDDFGALLGRASVHYGSGAHDQAIAAYGEIVKRYPDEPQPYNDYAWLLATSTKDEMRNGARAVELATKACALTEWQNAAYLDTLAAAYAERREFPEALKWQREAVRLAAQETAEVQAELQSRIALYEQQKGYREELK